MTILVAPRRWQKTKALAATSDLAPDLTTEEQANLQGAVRFLGKRHGGLRKLALALRVNRTLVAHAKVNIDYCITFDHRLYSVPYALVAQEVHVRATVAVVEILHRGERVASHRRSFGPKGVSVIADEHRPRAHRDYGRWPPERIVAWAASVGPQVGDVASAIMGRRTHPESGYRACLGLIRLADRYGRERVDAACARALAIESPSFKSVLAILKNGLDRAPRIETTARAPIAHEHLRGASYFNKEDENDLGRDNSKVSRDEDAHDGVDAARDEHDAADRTPLH